MASQSKDNLKGGTIRYGVISGLLFWLLWGGYMSQTLGVMPALIAGGFAGVLFGFSMYAFSRWLHRSRNAGKEVMFDLEQGEQVLADGPANHRLGAEYRGGWLWLTDRRLVFRPHSMNFQTAPVDLPLKRIRSVKTTWTFGVVPNGLLVEMLEGGTHRYVVMDRKGWVRQILAAMAQMNR